MAARFVASNPALAPLFAAVGAGVFGASWFGFHVLKNNQEVLIARGINPTPWNNIRQDQNTKASRIPPPNTPIPSASSLYSPNAEFWKSRAGLPDPRAAFTATSHAVHDIAHRASAKVAEVKGRALGRN
ncbi:hypothetical protein CTheo_8374 [Ceratobasidium theobromae]|uniref:NADH-ubiquinone reductase complex 1 MLRQ subunit n=1 Tax=Ceratobasidium theobromae TaxID=1582974 RepID=A0A5N5Q9V3_9AGAM|nr:hypothetical protein CTheo_8374 [Ceratobasidium theobromae]